jgi:hypothetical protein
VNQLAFPSEVTPQEIAREATLGGAISLCAKVAGFEPKQVQAELATDKAQFSRWTDDKEGIVWKKLAALMDMCGNDAPAAVDAQRPRLRHHQPSPPGSETEKALRITKEELAAVKAANRVLVDAMHGKAPA